MTHMGSVGQAWICSAKGLVVRLSDPVLLGMHGGWTEQPASPGSLKVCCLGHLTAHAFQHVVILVQGGAKGAKYAHSSSLHLGT